MDVTWFREKLSGDENRKRDSLRAVLTESHREDGTVKQRRVLHLGAIEERYLRTRARTTRAFHQGLFWVVVDQNLDKIQLAPFERKKIEKAISEIVPRPDGDWALYGVVCVPTYDR